ncbi:hypothetical protein [Planococcus soli]|uniref:hypothetical protein n=1 Tax=Planococcus soli TaxID=2666072 RepID=UPI00115D4360|nr:hypothetical protein [Planococcus soli]
MERLANAMEARGFLINRISDSVYFSPSNTREELYLVERMFKEIDCDVAIEGRQIHLHSPLTDEQLERIIWYPASNHEAGPDDISNSWKYFVKRRHGAKVNTFVLETGVARLVKSLSAAGISTFSSCDGHGGRNPYIIFSGRVQAVWFDLLYSETKRVMELNYDWKINWNSRMGPSLVADKLLEAQRWNLQDILADTTKIANFFFEHAEELAMTKRKIFGKRLKTTRKLVKIMSDEELYEWMSGMYDQYKSTRLVTKP